MSWKTKTEYRIVFDFALGCTEMPRLSIGVGEDEKVAKKRFKATIKEWQKGKIIVVDDFALRASEVEGIFLTKK